MAYTIDGNKISLVRGDSFAMPIMLTAVVPPSEEETTIFLKDGENLVFTVKESAYHKEIPIQHVYTAADCNADGVFTIALAPEETAGMEFGSYRFDLELNLQDRKTDTVCVGDFELTEEITDRICAEKLTPTDGSAVNISVLPTEIRRFRVMPSNIKGEDGKDGHSPYIGENGNWFEFSDETQEWVDTGIKAEGKQGPAGAPGKDGADGAQGPQGVPGEKGADGKNGADGANGEKGEKGEPGKDGADGKDGAPGADGKDGKDGAVPSVSPVFTLSPESWGGNRQHVIWEIDVNKRNVIDVAPESVEMWASCGVRAASETSGGIDFVCSETPTEPLMFRITSMEVVEC